jgi:predicted MPP superfamily phosphohydrolase
MTHPGSIFSAVPFLISGYGAAYAAKAYEVQGLYRINDSHLYVSRGIGATFTPVRLNAPPEVTLLHLK